MASVTSTGVGAAINVGTHRLPIFGCEGARGIGTDIGSSPTDICSRCCLTACGATLPTSVNIGYRISADRLSAVSVQTSVSARLTSVTDVNPLANIGTDNIASRDVDSL